MDTSTNGLLFRLQEVVLTLTQVSRPRSVQLYVCASESDGDNVILSTKKISILEGQTDSLCGGEYPPLRRRTQNTPTSSNRTMLTYVCHTCGSFRTIEI
eukprot:scaffold20466_cov73-Cylindrotheca_fusiformis.AAC.3